MTDAGSMCSTLRARAIDQEEFISELDLYQKHSCNPCVYHLVW